MNNIKVYNDNILIKVVAKKTQIVLPNKKEQIGMTVDRIEVVKFGEGVLKILKDIKEGDKVLIQTQLANLSHYNTELGEKTDEENPVLYYFIKAFDVLAIIKD